MRDPSLELEKPTPFPKVVLLLPQGLPLTTLGSILSANKLALLPGMRLKIIPRKNDKDSKDKESLWENGDAYM